MPKKTERRGIGSIYYSETHQAWVAEINLGKDPLTGKRKTIKRYFKGPETDKKTKREAEKKLADLISDHGRGLISDPSKITVQEWMTQHIKRRNDGMVNATKRSNLYTAEFINGVIGNLPLQSIQPFHIQQVIDASAIYAHSSRMKILSGLRKCFAEAYNMNLIARNPALQVQPPKKPRGQGKTGIAWTQAEVDVFLAAATAQRMFPLWCLAFATGARIGELQALKLQDLDLHTMKLRVERTVSGHTPSHDLPIQITSGKTSAAQRTVPLPEAMRPILQKWLERRQQDKEAAGAMWAEENWLFPTTIGTLTHYQTLYRNFQKIMQVCPIRKGTIHDIRRTYITLAIRAGVMPEVISKLVGHSSVLMTLEEYRKIQDDELDHAAQAINHIVQSAGEKPDLSLRSHYNDQMRRRPRQKKVV